MLWQQAAGWTGKRQGFDRPIVDRAAGVVVNQFAQRNADWHFVSAGALQASADGEKSPPFAAADALQGKPFAALVVYRA